MSARETVRPAVVVGAGAAGLTAAIFAGRAGVPALVLETRPSPGAKIRISGGGRCNVLPSRVDLSDFHTSGSRNTLRNILLSWPLADVRAFFERDLGVPLKDEPTGKVFPRSDDARDVVAALLREAARCGADILGGFRVASARRVESEGPPRFVLAADDGREVLARRVVLATGGLSLPKTGSDGGGLRMAERFGHRIAPTYPALVPLLGGDPDLRELAGVSVRVELTAEGAGELERREGDLLFTHRGFSGPVVLDASRHVTAPGGDSVRLRVRWGGAGVDWDGLLRAGGRQTVGTVVRAHLPRRLAALLIERAGSDPEQSTSELPRGSRKRLVEVLTGDLLEITGNEGFRTAEVTGGGVQLGEVNPVTLESRHVPDLFFCGEILDGNGRLGGYNFFWAWVTGRRAGTAVAAASSRSGTPPKEASR
jgi:predicted Rossmann fold flavoprotein